MSDAIQDAGGDEPAGWERNERDRRLIGLGSTPAERLAWLEEALWIAYEAEALPKRRPSDAEQE